MNNAHTSRRPFLSCLVIVVSAGLSSLVACSEQSRSRVTQTVASDDKEATGDDFMDISDLPTEHVAFMSNDGREFWIVMTNTPLSDHQLADSSQRPSIADPSYFYDLPTPRVELGFEFHDPSDPPTKSNLSACYCSVFRVGVDGGLTGYLTDISVGEGSDLQAPLIVGNLRVGETIRVECRVRGALESFIQFGNRSIDDRQPIDMNIQIQTDVRPEG